MSITAEEKKKYFAETALALSRAGFHVEEIPDNKLGVWLDEQPLCEVGEVGGITYRSDNISTPERIAAKDKRCISICATEAIKKAFAGRVSKPLLGNLSCLPEQYREQYAILKKRDSWLVNTDIGKMGV